MSLEQVALQQQDLNLGHDLNERIKVINFTSSGGMPEDFIVMYQLPESVAGGSGKEMAGNLQTVILEEEKSVKDDLIENQPCLVAQERATTELNRQEFVIN